MRQRTFKRKNKIEEVPRGEKVFNALVKGVCVDCSHNLTDVSPSDSDYQGENQKKCPVCGWQAQWMPEIK